MGRLVFTSGEILTAANMNELSDQSVMVFADSSARSSAIPSPSEGMVTFREDQDVVEVYDGSAFKTVGGLVAVESALKTDTFSASVSGGGNVAVTDLSITHEVSDPANKLIITAFFGMAASSNGLGRLGIAVHDGTSLIGVGDSAGSRTPVGAGGPVDDGGANYVVTMPAISFTYAPGSGSKTYTLRAVNIDSVTETLYVNRRELDSDSAATSRGVSSLVIMEVAV